MKNLPLLFLSMALLWPALSYAQSNKVSGTIQDENGDAIAYANVALLSLPDSTLVNGGISNEDGSFTLMAKKGQYFLQVSFLSYKTCEGPAFLVDKKIVKRPAIILQPAVEGLEEVTVESEKSQMSLKLDKRVFNVGKDLTALGTNASDLLDNIPSINVDVDGNVNLRGSQNVRILINGKPSGLVGLSTNEALAQLPSNLIERVEVITNPSARYDAEGEVGIINIIMKKERRRGFNGSFELKGGIPANHGLSTSLNYRREKVNYFLSYGLNYRRFPGQGSSFQEFYNSDSLQRYTREREHTRGGLSNTVRGGAEFFLKGNNTVTLNGLYKNGDGRNTAQLTYTDYDIYDNVLQKTVRDEIELEPENNIEFSINHTKKFEQKGREWSTDFQYMLNDETELANIEESYSTKEGNLYQRTSNTEDEENWLFQSDYIHPLQGESRFEAGVKSTNRIINNAFKVEQHGGNENWKINPQFNNQMVYTEIIHAAYGIISGKLLPELSYQAGLRVEYSDITTELLGTNEKNQRRYTNFFPSAHLTYEVNKEQSFQFSYSRRLSRPRFRHLLPFYGFSDNRNFYGGNPDLNPEYTHSFETGYVKYFDKGSFLGSVYYRHRTGVIQRVSTSNEEGIIFRIPVNLSTEDAYGIELNGDYKLLKDWNINASINAYRAITQGEFNDINLEARVLTANARVTSNVKLKDDWNFQLTFDYDAPRNNTQGRVLSRWALNTGLSYSFWDNKASLAFSGRDIFNTRIYRWVTDTEDFYMESAFQWRTRQFALTFTYRLKNQNDRSKNRRRGMNVNDNIKLN